MIAMPILALKAVPERQPRHVPAGVLTNLRALAQVTHTVDEALPVQRED